MSVANRLHQSCVYIRRAIVNMWAPESEPCTSSWPRQPEQMESCRISRRTHAHLTAGGNMTETTREGFTAFFNSNRRAFGFQADLIFRLKPFTAVNFATHKLFGRRALLPYFSFH